MDLDPADFADLTAFRRALHARPDLSGEELATAEAVRDVISATGPDRIVGGLGGHGLAIVYDGGRPGPTVMLRCELDALPIEEISDLPHRSHVPGKAHLCGHDGHAAILVGVGRALERTRPASGRVVLLFQPAEETGAGAAAVLADPSFEALRPDWIFALHNWPGIPFGEVVLDDGLVNCASRGLRIVLTGRTAHASMPETGISPMPALSALMPALTALGNPDLGSGDFAMVTVTHAALGEPAFGVAPGHAEIWATLRTRSDDRMAALCAAVEDCVASHAQPSALAVSIDHHDVFHHCENHPDAVVRLRRAMDAEGVPHRTAGTPMRPSEDFGRFSAVGRSAMFFLGAGLDYPSLHNPDYDFPDDLIPIGAGIFLRAVRDILG